MLGVLRKRAPFFTILPLLTLLGQTSSLANQTSLSIDLVAGFFTKIVPALLLLAVISLLFGFIRNISRGIEK